MTTVSHQRRHRVFKRMVGGIVALVVFYVLGAYLILPSLWSHYEHQPGLAGRPMMTVTVQGIPGDPLNVGLIGSKEEVIRAMMRAEWHPADAITLRSSVEISLSVVFDRPYEDAPVSSLFYDGRRQDLAFEKPVGNSADRRHHVRFWQTMETGTEGRPVWLGSASFDRGVGISHDTGQITHHIGPNLDRERDLLIADLSKARVLTSTYQVSGIGFTLNGRNGGGDPYFTDGEVTIGVISPGLEAVETRLPVMLPNPPAVTLKDRIWAVVVNLARSLRRIPHDTVANS